MYSIAIEYYIKCHVEVTPKLNEYMKMSSFVVHYIRLHHCGKTIILNIHNNQKIILFPYKKSTEQRIILLKDGLLLQLKVYEKGKCKSSSMFVFLFRDKILCDLGCS